jgi:uncharacterized protein YhbP (UPF0306 family)
MDDKRYLKSANKKAKKIVNDNIFMDLATSDKRGLPWATPIRYYLDNDYNFYFISSKHSRHMKNLEANPNIAFSIYDSRARGDDIDGLQIRARAKVLDKLELIKATKIIYKILKSDLKLTPTINKFRGIAAMRLVKIKPLEIYKLDTRSKPGEDTRIKVRL